MKNILVPTDFSGNAETALDYAIALALSQKATITLLHAYLEPTPNAYIPDHVLEDEKRALMKQSQEMLEPLCRKVTAPGLVCRPLSVSGAPVEAILATIAEKEIDLVVMGTKGITSLASAIFGSNAAGIIEKAKCPVIAVPSFASFVSIRKITQAISYSPGDSTVLKNLAEMAGPLGAGIELVHVTENDEASGHELLRMKNFMEETRLVIPGIRLTSQVLAGKPVEQRLEKYLDENPTDLLVLSTHHRSLFDKVFGKSVTKHMAYHSNTPLMAFHKVKSSVTIF